MVSNSAKLDRRTKQHTQFGVSASNGSRDMARTKSWRKKKICEKKVNLGKKKRISPPPKKKISAKKKKIIKKNLCQKKKKNLGEKKIVAGKKKITKRIGW